MRTLAQLHVALVRRPRQFGKQVLRHVGWRVLIPFCLDQQDRHLDVLGLPGNDAVAPVLQPVLDDAIGARKTGGFWRAPTGSVAKVASAQASNHPAGIRSACLSAGTPVSQRALA